MLKDIINERSENKVKSLLSSNRLSAAEKEAEIIGTELMSKIGNHNLKLVKRIFPMLQSLYNGKNEEQLLAIYNALRTGDSTNQSYKDEFKKMMGQTIKMFKLSQQPNRLGV